MKPYWIPCLVILVLLSGCTRPRKTELYSPPSTGTLTAVALTVEAAWGTATPSLSPSPFPTVSPLPSLTPSASPSQRITPTLVTKLTSTTTASRTPTRTRTSTPTPAISRAPTRTRTPTATPTLSFAAIQIFRPGPMSQVASPLELNAVLRPGSSGVVRIELLGEDGRILIRKVVQFAANLENRVSLQESLDFGISAVAETGRLQISTEDGYGRITALASVELLLISVGNSDVNPPGGSTEPIILREPGEKTLIQGGKLIVSGITDTSGTQPLLVELIASDGRIVGYRQASITGPAEGYDAGYFRFYAEVPYKVTSATWVRLTVKAYEDILPGPTHISSYEILLGP